MGGAVARTVAAVSSLGTAELFQEKPFQDVTKEDRPAAGGSSALRFFPAVSGFAPAVKQVLGQTVGSPPPSDREIGPNSDEEVQRRATTAQQTKTTTDAETAAADLAARTETAQEAMDSRKRAAGVAAQFLGGRRRNSASAYLLGGGVGALG